MFNSSIYNPNPPSQPQRTQPNTFTTEPSQGNPVVFTRRCQQVEEVIQLQNQFDSQTCFSNQGLQHFGALIPQRIPPQSMNQQFRTTPQDSAVKLYDAHQNTPPLLKSSLALQPPQTNNQSYWHNAQGHLRVVTHSAGTAGQPCQMQSALSRKITSGSCHESSTGTPSNLMQYYPPAQESTSSELTDLYTSNAASSWGLPVGLKPATLQSAPIIPAKPSTVSNLGFPSHPPIDQALPEVMYQPRVSASESSTSTETHQNQAWQTASSCMPSRTSTFQHGLPISSSSHHHSLQTTLPETVRSPAINITSQTAITSANPSTKGSIEERFDKIEKQFATVLETMKSRTEGLSHEPEPGLSTPDPFSFEEQNTEAIGGIRSENPYPPTHQELNRILSEISDIKYKQQSNSTNLEEIKKVLSELKDNLIKSNHPADMTDQKTQADTAQTQTTASQETQTDTAQAQTTVSQETQTDTTQVQTTAPQEIPELHPGISHPISSRVEDSEEPARKKRCLPAKPAQTEESRFTIDESEDISQVESIEKEKTLSDAFMALSRSTEVMQSLDATLQNSFGISFPKVYSKEVYLSVLAQLCSGVKTSDLVYTSPTLDTKKRKKSKNQYLDHQSHLDKNREKSHKLKEKLKVQCERLTKILNTKFIENESNESASSDITEFMTQVKKLLLEQSMSQPEEDRQDIDPEASPRKRTTPRENAGKRSDYWKEGFIPWP